MRVDRQAGGSCGLLEATRRKYHGDAQGRVEEGLGSQASVRRRRSPRAGTS